MSLLAVALLTPPLIQGIYPPPPNSHHHIVFWVMSSVYSTPNFNQTFASPVKFPQCFFLILALPMEFHTKNFTNKNYFSQ